MIGNPDAPVSIYGLIDPRTEQLHYVGSSENVEHRVQQHSYNSYGRHGRTKKEEWLQSLKEAKVKPDFIIFDEVPPQYRFSSEYFWIGYLRMIGAELYNNVGMKGGVQPSEYTPRDTTYYQ